MDGELVVELWLDAGVTALDSHRYCGTGTGRYRYSRCEKIGDTSTA